MKFIKKVQNFVNQYDLLPRGAKIVIGVSGGPDSVCLLDVLVKLAPKYDLKLHIAHVNYGLRGKDSDLDEKLVRMYAEKYKIGLSVLNWENKGSVSENSLRKERYDFFEKTRKKNAFDLIAVAHNKDDQAETVLMRLIRGAGLQGLSSMRPKNNRIIRPFLDVARNDILAYLKENSLKFRIDKTNRKPIFLRNKIRLELIPYLEKKYNPSIKENLASFAAIASQDYDYISQSLKMKKIFKIKEKTIQFSAKKVSSMHPSAARQMLRNAIEEIKRNTINLEIRHVEEILKIAKSNKNKRQISCFCGLKITRIGDNIEIRLK